MAIRKLLLCFFVRCMFSAPLRRMSSTGWTCSCPLNLSPRQIPGHFLTFARASLCSLKCPSKHVCASTPSVLIFPPRGTPVPRPLPVHIVQKNYFFVSLCIVCFLHHLQYFLSSILRSTSFLFLLVQ